MDTATYNWLAPSTGQPDSYNLYEGPVSGSETLLVNLAGSILTYSHTVQPGNYYARMTAVVGGVESAHDAETWAFVVAPFNLPQGSTTAIWPLESGKPANWRLGAVDLGHLL
ncbi:MAG: hypothetical protein ACRYFS_16185 [Janthinobacterium lividum]